MSDIKEYESTALELIGSSLTIERGEVTIRILYLEKLGVKDKET